MKRILLSVLIVVVLTGCKNKQEDSNKGFSNSESKEDVEKIDVDVYGPNGINKKAFLNCSLFADAQDYTIHDQYVWLIKNETLICESDDLIKCIRDLHLIKTKNDYIKASNNYWGSKKPVETVFTLGEFMSNCSYREYFTFNPDSEGKIHLSKINFFSTRTSCYSIPFFKSLKLNYPSLKDSDSLIFTLGRINGDEVVMFKIDKIADTYFDYSHFPTGRGSSFLKDHNYIPGKSPF